VSTDGHTYAFTLPAGRQWSDGTALTARDVAATISLVQSSDFPDTQLAEAWKDVAITVESPVAVTMRVRRPRGSFPVAIADLPILPTAAIAQPAAELAHTSARSLPTSGPYRVVRSDAATLLLAPNPHAPRPPPMHTVELRLLRTFEEALRVFAAGQADALVTTTAGQRAAAAAVPGTRLHDMVSFGTVQLLLNTASQGAGLDQPAVRHAIASAIDRRALVAAAVPGAGVPQTDPIPLGVRWVPHPTVPAGDPALAARTLDAAGWTQPGPGQVRTHATARLVERLMVTDEEPMPAVARQIAHQLRGLGVDVEVDLVQPASFETTLTSAGRPYDMALEHLENGADPDISSQWRSDEIPPKGLNISGLKADFVFDRALDRLAQESDPKLRRAAVEEVDRDLAASAPAVFLYSPLISLAGAEALDLPVPASGSSADRYDLVTAWQRVAK
jgi:ABC-type transport system substrate-binding protein